MKPRVLYAQQMAEKLLKKFKIQNEVGSVKLDLLCQLLGIEIKYKSLPAHVSGAAMNTGHGRFIIVNESHAPTRQNYTIGHEIGHHILHKWKTVMVDGEPEVYLRSPKQDAMEREANVFAAALIMPEQEIRHWLKTFKGRGLTQDDTIQKLSKLFNVSQQAIKIRIAEFLDSGRRKISPESDFNL
jgi:Zn-dependent peptidase ImmA (M78 family)